MLVSDLPIWGKFMVMDVQAKKVMHDFDGEGHGDIPADVAVKKVIAMYASDDQIIVEVE